MGYRGSVDRIIIESDQRSDPRIRGTPITVWDVYRALSSPRMTDSEVLSKYPHITGRERDKVAEARAERVARRLVKNQGPSPHDYWSRTVARVELACN